MLSLNDAFQELINSQEFAEIARKQDSEGKRHRLYANRFKRRELKSGAIVEMLIAHGYTITASKAVKKKSQKR